MSAIDSAIAGRRLNVPGVSKHLDALTLDDVRVLLGVPRPRLVHAEPASGVRDDGTWGPLWKPGDGRPALAPDSASTAQAMGRCAAASVRRNLGQSFDLRGVGLDAIGSIHPSNCGWCDFPLPELLKALAWATWSSRYVIAELAVWDGENGSAYVRTVRSGYYENPVWATFFEDWTPEQRRTAIEAATDREMAPVPA